MYYIAKININELEDVNNIKYSYHINNTSIKETDIIFTRLINTPEIISCESISLDLFNNYQNFILVIDFNNGGGGRVYL